MSIPPQWWVGGLEGLQRGVGAEHGGVHPQASSWNTGCQGCSRSQVQSEARAGGTLLAPRPEPLGQLPALATSRSCSGSLAVHSSSHCPPSFIRQVTRKRLVLARSPWGIP